MIGVKHSNNGFIQMKEFLYSCIYVFLIFLFPQVTYSQVTVEAKMDSSRIFIGQQVGVTIEVNANRGSDIQMPDYDSLQYLIPGIEIVGASNVDSSFLNEGKRVVVKRKYLLTSFDSALYYIPPFNVVVDGKGYASKSLALKVYTIDVDTLHTDSVFGLKAEMAPPFDWAEWRQLIWLSVLVFVLTLVLLYVVIRLKDNKPIIKRIKLKPRVVPHKVAMKKIEQIKEDKIWQKEDSKEYYTLLTDALRQYINDRYGFSAMEMTSYEIIQRLSSVNDEQSIRELKELFETADLVKFAKYNTLINENDRNLVSAIEYINQTKVEDTAPPQPEVIVVEEKSSKTLKIMMIASVCVTALTLVGVASFLVYRIIFLNM